MNKQKHRKIINKLINDSFPKLKRGKIILVGLNFKKYRAGVAWILPYVRVIIVSKKTESLNDKKLTGVLVHELCHFEDPKKLRLVFYWLIPKIRKIIEKETDELAVRKGYARELYESRKDLSVSCYLSPEEIKKYAKSIGKW